MEKNVTLFASQNPFFKLQIRHTLSADFLLRQSILHISTLYKSSSIISRAFAFTRNAGKAGVQRTKSFAGVRGVPAQNSPFEPPKGASRTSIWGKRKSHE